MYKKLLPVLLIPVIVFSAVLEQEYTFSKPFVENGIVCMEGCRPIKDPFTPCVSIKTVRLLVPYGRKPVSYSVSYGEATYLEGAHEVAIFKPGGRISVGPPAGYFTRKSPICSNNEFYPQISRSNHFYTQQKNGFAIFIAKINPVQYNPVTGVIRFYTNIRVSVTTETARGPVRKLFPYTKSLLQLYSDNPELLDNVPYTQKRADSYEYLIVTTDALTNSFGPLVEFNTRRGLRTQIQTIQYVKSNVTGSDDPDKLRNYIIDQYENNNIVFVLLGEDDDNNDANDVPHRGLRSAMYDYGTDYYDDKDVCADMYYSCLDGDWKDNNQYYGEYGTEDIGWEVYTARFCVDNATELTNIMNKTIKYSEQPVRDQVKNNLVAGEYSWGPPDHPVECYTKYELEILRDSIIIKNGFTTFGFGSSWLNDTLFDADRTWNKSDFISKMKNNNITWINHGGHSNNTYTLKTSVSDVNNSNFDNNGTNANFWIAYCHGCYQGSWDNRTSSGSYSSTDCIGEAWTSGIQNGAVAFISNSRYGLGDDGTVSPDGSDGSSPRFQRYFHDAIFGQKIHYLEMMNGYSKEVNADLVCIPESQIDQPKYFGQAKYVCYEVCVEGDPALSIWTEIPEELQADHPATIKSDATGFTWDTKKAYTTVALLDGARGDILCSQITGEDGKCEITEEALTTYLAANPNGKLGINVKAHNFLPYSGEIQIEPGSGIVTDTKFILNNNIAIFGKTIYIAYTLFNDGFVKLSVFDSKGALVKTVKNELQHSGEHSTAFSSDKLSNGIYYLRMAVNNNKLVRKFVVTK